MQFYIALPDWIRNERKRSKLLWVSVFVANLIAIILVWWNGSSHYYITNPDGGNIWVALGRIAGLLLEYAILVQLVLVGRITFIEKAFAFDKMNQVHRWIGYSLATLLVAHPLLLAIGYGTMNNLSLLTQMANFFATWEDVFDAFIGAILFAYIAAISVPIVRKKLHYETWHFTHLLTYVAVALAFGHQINSGDVAKNSPLFYWLALNFSVFGLLVLYRFVKPIYNFWYFGFTVTGVHAETPDTYSVLISGRHMDRFHFHAGQFAQVSFLQKGLWSIHPFSFSSEENGAFIRFTMKELGDHTKKIKTLRVGTRVLIEGPHGLFTNASAIKDKVLFIAGGIGVTPLRAMIGERARQGKESVLLYGVRTQGDIAFRSEFDVAEKNSVCRVHYIVSTPTEGYESGYLDLEKLVRLVPDFYERDVFVCGPPVMMDSTIGLLKRLGVTNPHIHFEKFSF